MLHITISTEPRDWGRTATAESIRPHLVKLMTAADRVGLTICINCIAPAQCGDRIDWRATWRRKRDQWSVDDWAAWFAQQARRSAATTGASSFEWCEVAGDGRRVWLHPQGH